MSENNLKDLPQGLKVDTTTGEGVNITKIKKKTNPYAKKTPTYDDGKYIGNLTQEEMRDYQEKQKEKKNTRPTRTKFKASGGRVTLKNGGRVAKGCGAVMPDRRKKTKYF